MPVSFVRSGSKVWSSRSAVMTVLTAEREEYTFAIRRPGATSQHSRAQRSRPADAGARASAAPRVKFASILLLAAVVSSSPLLNHTAAADEPDQAIRAAAASSYQIGGHNDCIPRYAHPSNTPDYGGYYVAGGAAFHGEERFPDEGTWGWDYFGRRQNRHIDLGWWHGARYQGGIGAYKTDGPKLLH